eukprot:scaffold5074_cov39-Phaeocystis_antarctica.AAC.1
MDIKSYCVMQALLGGTAPHPVVVRVFAPRLLAARRRRRVWGIEQGGVEARLGAQLLSLSPPFPPPFPAFRLFERDTGALQPCLNPRVVERAAGRETDAVRHAFDVDDALPLAHSLVCDGRQRGRGRRPVLEQDVVGRARAIGGARGL